VLRDTSGPICKPEEIAMRTLLFVALSAALAVTANAQTPDTTPASPPATQADQETPAGQEAPAGQQAPTEQPVAPPVPSAYAPPMLGQPAPQLNRATVTLEPTEGNRAAGTLTLSPDNRGLYITGTITGLKANSQHAFHFHQNGDCSAPDATSAGDHFNPAGVAHGNPETEPHHAGDMPNIEADGSGQAKVAVRARGVTLGDGGEHDVLGKAVIVHADADDYTSQPAGNAGARIACGVVMAPEATATPAEGEDDDGAPDA
jgi:Cu-Zn family superoxide dismutase